MSTTGATITSIATMAVSFIGPAYGRSAGR